jgi:predicted small metal-binding protein
VFDAACPWWESRTPVANRRRTMAYSIRCADLGTDCPGSFTTETKEELIKHVELHANEAHPDIDLRPEQVEALVKSSA